MRENVPEVEVKHSVDAAGRWRLMCRGEMDVICEKERLTWWWTLAWCGRVWFEKALEK